jgi:hypothetical protein
MAGPRHDTVTTSPRHSDHGAIRPGRRDIDGRSGLAPPPRR